MKRLIAVIALALLVTGCATWRANPVNKDQLALVESSYGVALALAVAYRQLPQCRKSQSPTFTEPCYRRSVVVKLQDADLKVQKALADARYFIKTYPTLSPAAYISAANIALSNFKSIQTENGIR